jgi:hypothetical protein
MKNSNYTIGNQTCDLLVCSAVPQTLCHHVPHINHGTCNIYICVSMCVLCVCVCMRVGAGGVWAGAHVCVGGPQTQCHRVPHINNGMCNIYLYIYISVCVCVCVCVRDNYICMYRVWLPHSIATLN